jgi:hypothetical protein
VLKNLTHLPLQWQVLDIIKIYDKFEKEFLKEYWKKDVRI